LAGETDVLGEMCSSDTSYTINLTCLDLGWNRSRRFANPAANRLRYDMTLNKLQYPTQFFYNKWKSLLDFNGK
jgi:hypothetical protein